MEKDKIKIPNDEGLIAELEAVQWEVTDKGNLKYTTLKGMNDDRVMSLALAVHGISEPLGAPLRAHHSHSEYMSNQLDKFDKYNIF